MDNRQQYANASSTPPSPPTSPSIGYPSYGSAPGGQNATIPGPYWRHQIGEELRHIIETAGLTPSATDLTQLYQAIGVIVRSLVSSSFQYALVRDQKASGIGGGAFTSGAWRVRDLTTIVEDGIGIALASNKITLPAGKYRCRVSAPGEDVNQHQAALYNVTKALYIDFGTSENASNSATDQIQTRSVIEIVFTLNEPTQIEIHHRCTISNANGFGEPTSFGNINVYTIAEFWRYFV